MKSATAIVALVAFALIAPAATYHVATSGNDGNSGTADKPFKTIKKGVTSAHAGDIVLVHPGTYPVTTGRICPNSGTKDEPVVIQSVKRHGAVITTKESRFFWADNRRDIGWITIRGFRFSNINNGAGWCITPGRKGWRIEDCVFEKARKGVQFMYGSINGKKELAISNEMFARGEFYADRYQYFVMYRCIFQEMGELGWDGHLLHGSMLIKDCIVRRGNRGKYGTTGTGGAFKILTSDSVRIENLVSYDHVGSGVWFDWDNTNFLVTGCTVFGNHGLTEWWQGPGMWNECGGGPKHGVSRFENNLVYSCTGVGLEAMETDGMIMRNNLVADCGVATGLRHMDRPPHYTYDTRITGNRFKDNSLFAAFTTSVGSWNLTDYSPEAKKVHLDSNIYEPVADRPLLRWGGTRCNTLDEVRERLGWEENGRADSIDFPFDYIDVKLSTSELVQVGYEGEKYSIDAAFDGQSIGDEVTIPVQGHGSIMADGNGWTTNVYDLKNNRHVIVRIEGKSMRDEVASEISRFAMWKPASMRIRIDKNDEYDFRGTVLSVDGTGGPKISAAKPGFGVQPPSPDGHGAPGESGFRKSSGLNFQQAQRLYNMRGRLIAESAGGAPGRLPAGVYCVGAPGKQITRCMRTCRY
jgi:hypothetical protein